MGYWNCEVDDWMYVVMICVLWNCFLVMLHWQWICRLGNMGLSWYTCVCIWIKLYGFKCLVWFWIWNWMYGLVWCEWNVWLAMYRWCFMHIWFNTNACSCLKYACFGTHGAWPQLEGIMRQLAMIEWRWIGMRLGI